MPDDYPQLDEALLNGMVEDFEKKEALPNPVVPLPPPEMLQRKQAEQPSLPVEIPPELKELPTEAIAPNTLKPSETPPIEDLEQELAEIEGEYEKIVDNDIKNLDLLENVFDKRVTDEQIQDERNKEESRNDSGRLLDKKDVEVKTELNDAEIVTISKLRFMAERYKIPVLKDFTDNLMLLKISRNRKGRGEFIQGLHADERREQPSETMWSKIFGGRGN